MLLCGFFLSSRRRHTRFKCDWSSDVCSSDLIVSGGVYRDLPETMPQYQASMYKSAGALKKLNENRQGSLLDFIEDFVRRFPKYVDEYETLLTDNRIWKQRTVNIGVASPEQALALGFSGPVLRGFGRGRDLRQE